MAALYYRCVLESTDKRAIERSMMQMEYLIHELKNSKVSVTNRIDMFFASGVKPIWYLEQMWAQLMLSLGLVKGALDVFLKLELWEEVITCYNLLELKHKVHFLNLYKTYICIHTIYNEQMHTLLIILGRRNYSPRSIQKANT